MRAPLRTLSAGNAQKVAVAQALLVPPGLLMLDEPWTGLDASAHGVLDEIIGEVSGTGTAVVVTDHRGPIVRATRAYAVAEGRLVPHAIESVPDPLPAVEVVLRPALPTLSVSDLRRMDGVLHVARHGEQVTVRVARSVSDRWLLAVLRLGWSVDAVGPSVAARGTAP